MKHMVWAVALALAGCGKSDTGPSLADETKLDTARLYVKKLAFEAYPSWAAENPDKMCPTLPALLEYLTNKDVNDPWGRPFEMSCGSAAPPGVRGIAVWSDGPDGKSGTCDDVQSWDDQHRCK